MIRQTMIGLGVAACVTSAQAATLTDSGDNGIDFLSSSTNVAIFSSKFQVAWNGGDGGYDGDGATFEDDEAVGEFVYDASLPITGIPAGEVFTGIELDVNTWNGRNQFDGQTLADIYTVEVSDDGINFSPITLAFTGDFPELEPTDGFALNTGSATGFQGQFVKVGILARVEAAGAPDNNNWSAEVFEVRLTSTPIPEPASASLLAVAAPLLMRRRRKACL